MIEKSVSEMVEYLAKALSENPDSVSIEEEDTEDVRSQVQKIAFKKDRIKLELSEADS